MAGRKNTRVIEENSNILLDLARKIETNRKLKHDFIASPRCIRVEEQPNRALALRIADQGSFPLRPIAHDQLGAFTGVPGRYYDRMLSEAPALLVDNLNHWLRRMPDDVTLMVRTLGDEVCAILPYDFPRVENEEVADVALKALFDIPDIEIVSAEITERRMSLVAIAPKIHGLSEAGNVVQAGILITNSEIEDKGTWVTPVAYCPELNTQQSFEGVRVPDPRDRVAFGAIIEAALDPVAFSASVGKLRSDPADTFQQRAA